jgi:hypothetical protein
LGIFAPIGVFFSIILSVVLILFGIDRSSSIIIGLCVTIVTLLLDIMARLAKAERRLIKVGQLNYDLTRNADLLARVSAMVDDYLKVAEQGSSSLFSARARYVLTECADGLHNLVEGYMILRPLDEFSFGLKGIPEVRRSIQATSYVDAESFWRSVAGEKYYQANVDLLARDVKITRVFIGDRDTLNRSRSFIARQKDAGIAVLLALVEEIPRELCEDYLIADEVIVTQLQLTREGVARTEKISIDPQEVRQSMNNFNRLVGGAHSYGEFFPDAAA